MIMIDGIAYKASWVKGMTQTADIINGEGSGRLQGNYKMHLEYLGTFYNHTGQLRRDRDCTDAEWAELYMVLSNPINNHVMPFPFGVDQTITQEVYIAKISRGLLLNRDTNKWDAVYNVELPSKAAAWMANGTIKGLSG